MLCTQSITFKQDFSIQFIALMLSLFSSLLVSSYSLKSNFINGFISCNLLYVSSVEKPNTKLGIGFDQLPIAIKESIVFTANEKAQLANTNITPSSNTIKDLKLSSENIQQIKAALSNNDTERAWAIIQTLV